MIVIDASVFIDLLFKYNSARTRSAEELFFILEEEGLVILEPEIPAQYRILPGPACAETRKNSYWLKLLSIRFFGASGKSINLPC
jgi:hypothetical protein